MPHWQSAAEVSLPPHLSRRAFVPRPFFLRDQFPHRLFQSFLRREAYFPDPERRSRAPESAAVLLLREALSITFWIGVWATLAHLGVERRPWRGALAIVLGAAGLVFLRRPGVEGDHNIV